MNFFGSKVAAERYVAGRPDFHANTIGHLKEMLGIDQKLPVALDVACGTGLSTKALLSVADEVYGTDLSPEMLDRAYEKDKIRYIVAAAENQPFEDEEFDLITVSSAIHWFDIDAFLTEARRILKTKGWLVIYENYFTGKMDGNDDFTNWVNEVYLTRFPSPPRNKNYGWSVENIRGKGFSINAPGEYENAISFNKEQLIAYFTTQSNVIAAIDSGRLAYKEAEKWLAGELRTYFESEAAAHVVYFGNRIKYLQKTTC